MPTSLLIVDDSTFSRNMIKRALPSEWDVEVTEVICGEEALEVCQLQQFDIIFLDLTMPDIDGLDVLQTLNERGYQSRIFIISADIQESSKQIAKERGAVDFFPKPITTETLLSMLKYHEVI
ncbi:response regulator [Psychromonas antarctica]|jgi:two-component system chemotaxis response regulator CheY|uniref:response regulator n=1 Tax=Psychromonas antarctica TaxID=67573 RepID=UPI001EE95761|nr:response regulator [Psychromonas antarctica]MCG6200787.1 response regulator [Psychromonas antarctica]